MIYKTKIDAIKYVVKNGSNYDEWSEAYLYQLVVEIINSKQRTFDSKQLNKVMEDRGILYLTKNTQSK